jgi:hypothetical protein
VADDVIDWPDFDVPAEALNEGVDRSERPAAPESTGTPPAAATPPAGTATPPAAPAAVEPPASAAVTPGSTPPTPPVPDDDAAMVPRYRLNETTERARKAEAEATRLRAEVESLRRPAATPPAATPPAPPAATDLDPADVAIRDRLLKVMPELKNLAGVEALIAKNGSIESAIAAVEGYRQAEQRYYERHADRQIESLHRHVAEYMLGKDKPIADLPELTRQQVSQAFAQWVSADPARTARYDALDERLVGEFWPIYRAAMFDPVRRDAAAATLTAHNTRPALPPGGGSGVPPVPGPKKTPSSDPEDEIFDRAWNTVKEQGVGG